MRGPVRAVVILVLATLGLGTWWLISSRRQAAAAQMRAQILTDIERGGVNEWARAQLMARRLILADPGDAETAAALAFVDAALAVDYGLDTARETRSLLTRHSGAVGSSDVVTGMLVAARALMYVASGDRESAARVAVTGTAAAPGVAFPFYALGRARALSGDLGGAARAMEAAMVRAPSFLAARLSWAEARLDQGDAKAARPALVEAVARAPEDVRSRLLLEEAEHALGRAAPAPVAACVALEAAPNGEGAGSAGSSPTAEAIGVPHSRWPPPAIKAACALGAATRARLAGRRTDAVAEVERAAGVVPNQARLLGRTVIALAQFGLVDWAAALLERARKLAAPEVPTLAWGALAVSVGKGRVPMFPGGPRPADPESRLLAARASLAAGGAGALASTLTSLPPAIVAGDRDLLLLTRLGRTRDAGGPARGDEPLRDYVDGLRAKFDGDLTKAVERFGHALSGHGDACRAAGEYVATMGLLKRPVPAEALTALRAENNGCVNVR